LRYITSKGGAVPKIENRFLVVRLSRATKKRFFYNDRQKISG